MILFILAGLIASNFLSTMISYSIGSAIYHLDLSLALPQPGKELSPAWTFTFPRWLANDHALFGGIFFGILCSFLAPSLSHRLAQYFDRAILLILKVLTCLIPLFISGFVMKLIHDAVLKNIVQNYLLIFLLVGLSLLGYISFIYLAANRLNFPRAWAQIKNMLPASLAGFSSMSSAAAMPLTIMGCEKNAPQSPLARLAIPVTVNTHLMGDCFAIPIFAFAVMKNFGASEPAFLTYLGFACFFVLAKFSVAAIPGGGILVMLPVLENQLGFTQEMSLLITALYILFDPVITCANVSGNGGFAIAMNQIYSRWKCQEKSEERNI
jgi:Na+/H+-dicarboxylate symporter